MSVNLKNIGYKAFWTLAAVFVAFVITEVAKIDPQPQWMVVLTTGLNYISALIREQLGRTTPDLPPPA